MKAVRHELRLVVAKTFSVKNYEDINTKQLSFKRCFSPTVLSPIFPSSPT